MSIIEMLTRKQISFYNRFEQDKSYTSYMWTMPDNGLRGGIASQPQASLGLPPKLFSIHRQLRRRQHASSDILHSWFKPRTSLAKLVVFMSLYYLLMTHKVSVCNRWKCQCCTTDLVFYKLIYICTYYLILSENISDNIIFCHALSSAVLEN